MPKNVACIVPVDPISENSDANWISYVFWITEKDINLLEIGSWHKTSAHQSSHQITFYKDVAGILSTFLSKNSNL